jgi:hypothetical protein
MTTILATLACASPRAQISVSFGVCTSSFISRSLQQQSHDNRQRNDVHARAPQRFEGTYFPQITDSGSFAAGQQLGTIRYSMTGVTHRVGT